MPQAKDYKDYYTAAEVKSKLGITDGMLYNYVRYGHLDRIIPPGRKQGVYKREQVDKFALEMKAFLGSNSESRHITFTAVSVDDVPENVKLTESVFGSSPELTIKGRTRWIERNPEVSYQLTVDGSLIGCVTMLPLQPEKIEKILREEAKSEATTPEEIEQYQPRKAYHLYVMGACVSPTLSKQEKRWFGAKLVRGLLDTIIDFGKQGIEIETITAQSETVDGIRLMRHLGFMQIPSTTQNVNFRINVKEADKPEIIQEYRRVLQIAKEEKPRGQKT